VRGGTRRWAALTFDSLRVKDYRYLWIGMLLSMGGMQMQMFTRGLQAYDLTNSGLITSIVALGWAPTMLLTSLYGGVLGERLERRSLIQFAQASNAVIPAVTGALTLLGVITWSHLLAAALVQGFMFAVQMPARQAVIPRIVGKDRVSNALALNASGMGLMNVIGPAVAGLMYEGLGPGWSYVVGASIGMLAVGATGMVPKMYPDRRDGPRRSALSEIGDGLNYIRSTPMVRTLIVQGIVFALLAMPFRMLIQVFAKEVYGADATQIGIMGAVAGVGAVIGALWIAGLRPGQRRGAVLMGASVVGGTAMMIAAGFPWYAVGILAMALAGLGESGRMSLGQSLVIEQSEDRYRARVTSVLMMTFGLMPFAALPLGYAYDHMDARWPVMFMGAVLVAASVWFIVSQPKLRRLP
jgi:MFS family permease